jgi:hypothetical protein
MSEYRQFDGKLKILQKVNEFTFRVELWLLNGKVNRNGWRYENLRQHMAAFADKPILIAYPKPGQIGDGHNFRMVTDPKTGELVPSFMDADAEHIVGRLSERPEDVRMETLDGVEWIVGTGIIWKWYARELVERLERDAEQGRGMEVSIETLVLESHMDGEVEVETRYEILGTTILGDHVAPAVAGARIKALQALKTPFAELKLRAASYEQPQNKPKNETQKGVKNVSKRNMSKAQMESIKAKLPGYTVLSAHEADDGTYKIVAASNSGEIMSCSVAALNDENIKPEALAVCALTAQIDESAELNVNEAMANVLTAAAAENRVLSAQVEKLTADLAAEKTNSAELQAKMTAMETAEKKRRCDAAAKAAKDELAKINAVRCDEDKYPESCCDPVVAAAEKGDYTDCCDPDGNWNGAEKACAAVRDLAMQEQMKRDAAKASVKTVYAFDGFKGNSADDPDSVEALYASMVG